MPLEEVAAEWAATHAAGELQSALRDESPAFGGLWVVHEPTFEVEVGIAGNHGPEMSELLKKYGLSDVSRVVEVRHSLAKLQEDQAEVAKIASSAGLPIASGIDQSDNQVVVIARDRGTLRRLRALTSCLLPP